MYKLFLFVAFLAFAAAAPGAVLSPALLPYSATLYNPGYAAPYAAPYAYSAYSSPLAYSYSALGPYPAYKTAAYYAV